MDGPNMVSLSFRRSVLALGVLAASACTFTPGASLTVTSGAGGDAASGAGGATDGGGAGSGGRGGTGARDGGGTGGAVALPCSNLECRQNKCTRGACTATACAGGAKTTVSGTVYDPAGKVPLYNVIVYVPNAALSPMPEGASCDRCNAEASGKPIATAITDVAGHFVLEDVPVGADVPLVIQVGKWRREITVPNVASCADTALTDKNVTRLPRNRIEGHLPRIALSTGEADALECLLRKIGIEDSEFTPEGGEGRVNLFAGYKGTNKYQTSLNGGAAFTAASPWWDSKDNLMKYDLVLHSCEGTESPTNKSTAARQAFIDYTSAGGRAFLSHWHNYWIEHGPDPLPTVATFHHQDDPPSPFTAQLDTTFPKGDAMANWLVNVGGSTTKGQLVINGGQHTVDAVNATYAQRWIYSDAMPAATQVTLHTPSVQYFTFNTPLTFDPDQVQCGRVVMSDIHVSNAGTPNDSSSTSLAFPSGCRATDLSPQEKALEFMLFDLSSCIRKDTEVPVPPIVP